MFRPTVLMVDDDASMLSSVRRTLSSAFKFVSYTCPEEALLWLADHKTEVDAILADLVMPEMDGIRFLKSAYRIVPDVPRLLLSGNLSSVSLRDAINHGMVSRVLAKPVPSLMLKAALNRCITDPRVCPGYHCVTPAMVNRALENGDHQIVFQPRVRATDCSPVSGEILSRFPGLQARFNVEQIIEACEDHPVINRLTMNIFDLLDDVVDDLPKFKDGPLQLSVNFSPYSLANNDFITELLDHIDRLRRRNIDLEVEITEHNVKVLCDPFIENARFLKSRGVKLLIDDFGAGNNSIQLLRQDIFSGIKLDRTLVDRMMTEILDDSFVAWTIEVAHRLGFEVIAEGVETREVADRLQTYGVDQMQGYYFGRPAPIGDPDKGAAISQAHDSGLSKMFL